RDELVAVALAHRGSEGFACGTDDEPIRHGVVRVRHYRRIVDHRKATSTRPEPATSHGRCGLSSSTPPIPLAASAFQRSPARARAREAQLCADLSDASGSGRTTVTLSERGYWTSISGSGRGLDG